MLLCATCILALAGAATMLFHGMIDWSQTSIVFEVIDRLLVVLMVIEILHTVLVSLRSGTLVCEPFLIVGLIASIRRMLVITLESSQGKLQGELETHEVMFRSAMMELVVLGGLILILVASIWLLRRQSGDELREH